MAHRAFLGIISDTGFGFSLVSLLYFSNVSTTGFAITLMSLSLITFVKIRAIAAPASWAANPRRPMQIAGCSLLAVAATLVPQIVISPAVAADGAMMMKEETLALIGPFLSALSFGTANILLANTISGSRPIGLPLYRNPETFLFIGYLTTGLKAGGLDVIYTLPIIVAAFTITLVNSKKNLPLHTRHPVRLYALAEVCFAGMAVSAGLPLLAAANLLCAIYLMRIDYLISPKAEMVSVPARPSAMP